jgi:PAS domain S-box-containing protein
MVKDWFKKNGLILGAYLLAIPVVVNTGLILYLNHLNKDLEAGASRTESALAYMTNFRNDAFLADMAARDVRMSNDGRSMEQYEGAVASLERDFDSLKYNLKRMGYDDALVGRMEVGVSGNLSAHYRFLEWLQVPDSIRLGTINSGPPSAFDVANREFAYFQDHAQNEQHRASLTDAIDTLMVLQVLLLVSVPVLIILPGRLKKSRQKLIRLNREIDECNRKYVFDPIDEVDIENEQAIKSRLLENLRRAASFIQQVSQGNYAVRWEGMNDQNREANSDNIAGELIRMRERMKKVKEEDEIRMWMTEGFSKFGGIIQKNQENLELLGDTFISGLVKYLDAKVGALFILEEDTGQDPFLELKACYAYERKKYIKKRIAVGEGIAGQTFLEGQSVYLRDVPGDYMMITSALGEANPGSLAVVPLLSNNKVEGVLELASLNEIPPYQIEFLERIGESLAASLVSVRSSERTRTLLQMSQQQSEEVRAQEEEMRQNMEELEATQEQMNRQVAALNKLKEALEVEKYLFGALMENIPESIYFKDRESRFLRVSKHLSNHFGKGMSELIGKSDFDFQDEIHAREAFEDEKDIMRTRIPKVDYVEKEVLKDGSEHFVSTTKMPLADSNGNVVGTFGISRDVTHVKLAELELLKKEKLLTEMQQQSMDRIRQLEEALAVAEKNLEKAAGKRNS